jgi:hypothetical protein
MLLRGQVDVDILLVYSRIIANSTVVLLLCDVISPRILVSVEIFGGPGCTFLRWRFEAR